MRRLLRELDVEVALRAAVAAVVPLAVLLAVGRPEWAPYAAFGGMAAIFGRREPYRLDCARWAPPRRASS